MITIAGNKRTLTVDAEKTRYAVTLANGDTWHIEGRPYVSFTDGSIRYLDEAKNGIFTEYRTGIGHGVKASYDLGDGMMLYTRVSVDDGLDDVWFTSRLEGDAPGAVQFVSFPSPVTFDVPKGFGYTVLPRIQRTTFSDGTRITVDFDQKTCQVEST